MKGKIFLVGLLVLLIGSILVAGCSSPAPTSAPATKAPATSSAPATTSAPPKTTAAPTTSAPPATSAKPAQVKILKGVTDNPTSDSKATGIVKPFVEAVNKRLAGEVQIQWAGGPEIIPQDQLADAVRSGVIDICLSQARSRPANIVQACLASDLSQYDGAGERQSGAYEVWDEAYQKFANAHYLGLTDNGNGAQYYLCLNKNITKLADVKGAKLRVFGAFEGIAKALGASPMALPLTDVYTAMQRGVVDGYITNPDAMNTFKLQEVTKYIIQPGFQQIGAAVYINLDVWKSLSPNAQKVITEESIAREANGKVVLKDVTAVAWKNIYGAGTKDINLSADEATQLVNIAYSAGWDYVPSSG